ncbi:MAG: acyl--CoA ligase, partial [Candidatus Blackburnbacteria bacterium]|nr:acyl--CoA ligase [Candidatus Blackburnbacteria bacterium]
MSYQNLGQLVEENSQKHGDKIAYQIKRGLRTERLTFGEVHSLALKTATFLQKQGLKKGDKVAIWASNMPEYPILYFGCWLGGFVAVPIDVRTTEDTLRVFLEKARCLVGFKGRYVPGEFPKDLVDKRFVLEDLVSLVDGLSEARDLADAKPEDLAEIAFTSGTTGTPKGVMLT